MRAVIKLGGSIFTKNGVNKEFLQQLVDKIKTWNKKHDLAIVVGAGHISREYGKIGQEFTNNQEVLDQIGIMVARTNAALLIATLGNIVASKIPTNESEFIELAKESYPSKVIVLGGFRPGQRTDAVSVEVALEWGADVVVKCTDVDYVYDKDPNNSKDAKPIKEISFQDLEKLVHVDEYKANAPTIMDTKAAELLVQHKGLKVAVVNGEDLENIGKVLDEKEFKGTRIGF